MTRAIMAHSGASAATAPAANTKSSARFTKRLTPRRRNCRSAKSGTPSAPSTYIFDSISSSGDGVIRTPTPLRSHSTTRSNRTGSGTSLPKKTAPTFSRRTTSKKSSNSPNTGHPGSAAASPPPAILPTR